VEVDYKMAEELLDKYRAVKNKIKNLQLQLERAEADRQAEYDRLLRCSNLTRGIKALYDDTGHAGDPVGNAVRRIVDLFTNRVTNIQMQLSISIGEMEQIEKIVNSAGLSYEEQQYIYLRYYDGLKAWETANKIGYSESRAFDIRRSALKKINSALKQTS
jgi:predicted DNA-binding protein (UPF0251 family)